MESKAPVMDGAIAACFKCRKAVVLGLTDHGAILPLDPGPSETGGVAVSVPAPGRAPRVRYLRGHDPEPAANEQRMKAHWDTHPRCRPERKRLKHLPKRDEISVGNVLAQQQADRISRRRPVPASPGTGPRDMTLAELATADLGAIMAAADPQRRMQGE